jgi:hypothetical protein
MRCGAVNFRREGKGRNEARDPQAPVQSSDSVETHMPLQGGGEMGQERGLGPVGVTREARVDDFHVLAQRAQRQGRGQAAIEPNQPQIIVHPAIGRFDQRIIEAVDDGVVEQQLQGLQFRVQLGCQAVGVERGDGGAMTGRDRLQLGLVGGFGIDPYRRPLDDGAILIGRLGQLEPRLDELDARAGVDGEHALRFKDA